MPADINAVIELKIAEIQALVEALTLARNALVGISVNRVAKPRKKKRRSTISSAGRAKLSRAMKARWAEVKRAKEA